MAPGTQVPAAAGAVPQYAPPATIAPSAYVSPTTVPPYTVPAQVQPGTAYPYAPQTATATSPEAYLEALGKPKAGATVTGPLPPAGLFPEFKGSVGPKQKACIKGGGVWTGPKGKKFCVKAG
jgi:hypothetical protein